MALGLSPQVVTETVYALAVMAQPPFIPTEVRVLTTREGADRARLSLLSPEPGWFRRLLREYDLPEIAFDEGSIQVLRSPAGEMIDDIRTEDDNRWAADAIARQIRDLTADDECALHVSIAGGRKTMGFYMGYALSLYGRPQDRLSHVLVSAPFESHPSFYFPTRTRQVIYSPPPDSRPLDTSTACVTLAEIPFVRLRSALNTADASALATFSGAVSAAQDHLGPPRLRINLKGRFIQAAAKVVTLRPSEMAFYSMLARRAAAGLPGVLCPSDGAPEPELAAAYLSEYQAVLGEFKDIGATCKALQSGMDRAFFNERKSRVQKRLREVLGVNANPYLIHASGRRPETRFGITLPADCIEWDD